MAAEAPEIAGIDLFDHRQSQNLDARTREWRAASPIVRLQPDLVYVARWQDCWEVLRDPARFGNANGFKRVEVPEEERMLGEMDPPRHPLLRRVMRSGFTRAAVAREQPFARARAERLLDAIAAKPGAELVGEFCDQLPNDVSLHMLGVPERDAAQIVCWAKELLHSDWPALNRTARGAGLAGAFPEFAAYLDGLVAARRAPGAPDDLIARLARSELGGAPLSPTVLRALAAHVILGGFSTSTNLLGSLLYRLLREPALHARLRARPALVAAAVEESLRLDPPVLFVLRNAMRDCELRGVPLAAGQRVAVGIASANRDERVFDDAESYRLDRGAPRHLSFSGGAHLCIGAGVARLVAREALRAFALRFEVGELALAPGFEVRGVPVFLENGPERLEVRRARGARG